MILHPFRRVFVFGASSTHSAVAILVAIGLSFGLIAWAQASPAPEVVCTVRFDRPESLEAWSPKSGPGIALETVDGVKALAIERSAPSGAGSRSIRMRLPVEALRARRIEVTARAKAQDVAQPPKSYNGIKCMLHYIAPDGPKHLQQSNVFGTFDWRTIRFTAEVPPETTEAWLVLGLEATTGKVWFEQVTLKVVGERRAAVTTPLTGPIFTGHTVSRLRGTMVSPRMSADDLRVLGGTWKANHVRWQLTWGGFPRSPADQGDLAAYDAWLDSALKHLDELLPLCRELGVLVTLDLHTPPGGRNDSSECRMFKEPRFQEAFLAAWEKMATRYRGNKSIWGYDLVNEPVEGSLGEGVMDWHSLATVAARRVRQIDPDHAIIIEPGPWGSPAGLDWFEPIDVPGVVYSVHMYQPHRFTHQGVHGSAMGAVYPGEIEGQMWDKQRLRKTLEPARRYQQDYHVQIYIGEFSAIRWAPGDSACQYLSDCIDLFEEYGWDWAYHAFREWDGWSVEHGPDPKDHRPAAEPTDRQRLLQSWFGRNERP